MNVGRSSDIGFGNYGRGLEMRATVCVRHGLRMNVTNVIFT
jgi:hypothetical protein